MLPFHSGGQDYSAGNAEADDSLRCDDQGSDYCESMACLWPGLPIGLVSPFVYRFLVRIGLSLLLLAKLGLFASRLYIQSYVHSPAI